PPVPCPRGRSYPAPVPSRQRRSPHPAVPPPHSFASPPPPYRTSPASSSHDRRRCSTVSPNSSMIAWAAELPVRPLRTITSAILSRSSFWSLIFDQLRITRKLCPDAVTLAV